MASTNIRRVLTFRLNQMRAFTDRAQVVLQRADAGEELVAGDVLELQRCRTFILEMLPRVDEKVAEWERLITGLPGLPDVAENPRGAEQQVYDGYQPAGVHFIEIVEGARLMVAQMEVVLREADEDNRSRTGSSHSSRSSRANRNHRQRGDHGQAALAAAIDAIRETVAAVGPAVGQAVGNAVGPAVGRNAGGRDRPAGQSDLKKLSAPVFSGDPLEWSTFWQNFESSVERYPTCDKMRYLMEALKGTAAQAVKGYPSTAENYPVVVEILRTRFGDPKIVADAQEAELANLPMAGESIHSLRSTAETLGRVCRELALLGWADSQMLRQAKSKFPDAVVTPLIQEERNWKKRPENLNAAWTVTEFLAALREFIEVREEVRRLPKSKGTPGKAVGNDRGVRLRNEPRIPQAGTQAFAAMARESDSYRPEKRHDGAPGKSAQRGPKSCLFCEGIHWMEDCSKVVRTDERKKKLAEMSRCFKCIRRGHVSTECRSQAKCRGCAGDHHRMLCPNPRSMGSEKEAGSAKRGANFGRNRKVHQKSIAVTEGDEPLLMTKRVRIPDSEEEAFVFFDPGAQTNFVERKFGNRVGAPKVGSEINLDVYPYGTRVPRKVRTEKRLIRLMRQDGGHEEVVACTTDCIGTELMSVTSAGSPRNPGVRRASEQEPDILIGLRDFWRFFLGKEEGPHGADSVIIHTTLGDVLCGSWQVDAWTRKGPYAGVPGARAVANAVSVSSQELLPESNEVTDFWSLETIGIMDDPQEDEDQAAKEAFQTTVEYVNGRYRVGWPWRDKHPDLQSNYNMAYSRLAALLKKLQANPELARKYDAIFAEQLEKGIIEPAERREGHLEHFLPHHAVVTHKIRSVCDASAHVKGCKSLNQCLYRGPVMLPELVGMLFRFRLPAYPILADVEKAFLNIELIESDREVVKLLWVKDVMKPLTSDNLVVYRGYRVLFGVICSPYLLAAVLKYHLEKYGTPLAVELTSNTYVDNILMGVEVPEEAFEKYKESRTIFQAASMNLREFVSTAPGFMQAIPPEHRLDKEVPKVLGVPWLLKEDAMRIDFPTDRVPRVTRRTVLKTLASVFDPQGLVSPCLLPAKLLFQELWKDERQWDTPVSNDEAERWKDIEAQWINRAVYTARRIRPEAAKKNSVLPQLHTFVDASQQAYACCVYLHFEGCSTHLVYAKSRLRPTRSTVTIPRMELMAMLVGVRASALVKRELALGEALQEFVWGDSKVVLSWINSREHQPRFIANRLAEIRRNEQATFGYVNTADNPSDIGTRGATPEELQASELWWHAANWLQKPASEWPKDMVFKVEPTTESDQQETATFATRVRKSLAEGRVSGGPSSDGRNACGGKANGRKTDGSGPERRLFNFERFYSWAKVVRTVAQVRRFINRARKLEPRSTGEFTAKELKMAESLAFKLAQADLDGYGEKRQLRTIVDANGIIRLNTRIGHSHVGHEVKTPILLSKDSPAAAVIIYDAHRRVFHAGVDATLTEFLQQIWMPGARRMVKATLSRCVLCRKAKGPAYALPMMPALPADRVVRRHAFESVGIDYLGPTMVRSQDGLDKAWICLITCLTTRGVYLEPVWDLSGDQFLQVFRRFASIRRRPDRVLSDNGTQFRLAARVLRECLPPLSAITWNFIGQISPWQGGVYERLVALVKNAFKTTLGRRTLDKEDLRTFTAEVAAALNCRPLTFVSTEPDSLLPLRPADFLNPGADMELHVNFPDDPPTDKTATSLLRHWEAVQATQDYFWNRWSKEYLLMLREKAGWFHKGKRSQIAETPRIGEVVLLEEAMRPRNQWSLARIVELQTRAGEVRNVKLKMPNGHIWSRPVNRIYPLEAAISEESPNGVAEASAAEQNAPEVPIPNSPEAESREAEFTEVKGKKKCKAATGQRTHGMVTRALTKIAAGLTAVAVLADPASGRRCDIVCATDGVVVRAEEPAYWCCDGMGCVFEHNATNYAQDLTEDVMKGGFACNMVCRSPDGRPDPVSIWCEEPRSVSAKIADESPVGHWAILVIISCLIVAMLLSLVGWYGWRRKGRRPSRPTVEQRPTAASPSSSKFVDVPLTPEPESARRTMSERARKSIPERARTSFRRMISVARCTIPAVVIALMLTSAFGDMSVPSLRCTTRGIAGSVPNDVIKSEICCRGAPCHIPEAGPAWEHHLPEELLVIEHTCDGEFWRVNQSRLSTSVTCPPIDECQLIACRFCVDIVANPMCYPMWTLLIYGCWFTGLLAAVCLFLTASRELWRNCKCVVQAICSPVACVIGWCRARVAAGKEPVRRSRRRRYTHKDVVPKGGVLSVCKPLTAGTASMVIMAGFIGLAIIGCKADDAVMSTALTEDCHREGNLRWCEWNHVSTMTLLPAGQPVTLLMKGADGQVFGTLQISLRALTTVCLRRSEHWTWAYRMRTEAVKRCPTMGLCSGGQCGRWNIDDPVPELESCNNYPCHRFCASSCSTWWCGCAVGPGISEWWPACVFYGNYAEPVDDLLYEVFSCPTWEHHIETEIIFETEQNNETRNEMLHPGMTFRMGNLSVTPLAISQAPAPVMTEHFVSDGERVALVGSMPYDLVCATKEAAESRNCTLALEVCTHCVPDPSEAEVNCQCRDSELEAIMGDAEQRLPVTMAKLDLRTDGNRVWTETSYAPIQLMVKVEHLRLATETAETLCQITPVKLTGCYSCTTGGQFSFKCETNGAPALVTVTCEDGSVFPHRCSASGIHSVVMAFNRSSIDMACRAACPSGETKFRMVGELRYVPRRLQARFRSAATNSSSTYWLSDFDFNFDIFGALRNLLDWRVLMAVIGVTAMATIVVWLFVKCNPALRGYRLLARAVMVGLVLSLAGGELLQAEATDQTEAGKGTIMINTTPKVGRLVNATAPKVTINTKPKFGTLVNATATKDKKRLSQLCLAWGKRLLRQHTARVLVAYKKSRTSGEGSFLVKMHRLFKQVIEEREREALEERERKAIQEAERLAQEAELLVQEGSNLRARMAQVTTRIAQAMERTSEGTQDVATHPLSADTEKAFLNPGSSGAEFVPVVFFDPGSQTHFEVMALSQAQPNEESQTGDSTHERVEQVPRTFEAAQITEEVRELTEVRLVEESVVYFDPLVDWTWPRDRHGNPLPGKGFEDVPAVHQWGENPVGGHPPPLAELGGHPPPLAELGGHPPPLAELGGHPPPLAEHGGHPPPLAEHAGHPPSHAGHRSHSHPPPDRARSRHGARGSGFICILMLLHGVPTGVSSALPTYWPKTGGAGLEKIEKGQESFKVQRCLGQTCRDESPLLICGEWDVQEKKPGHSFHINAIHSIQSTLLRSIVNFVRLAKMSDSIERQIGKAISGVERGTVNGTGEMGKAHWYTKLEALAASHRSDVILSRKNLSGLRQEARNRKDKYSHFTTRLELLDEVLSKNSGGQRAETSSSSKGSHRATHGSSGKGSHMSRRRDRSRSRSYTRSRSPHRAVDHPPTPPSATDSGQQTTKEAAKEASSSSSRSGSHQPGVITESLEVLVVDGDSSHPEFRQPSTQQDMREQVREVAAGLLRNASGEPELRQAQAAMAEGNGEAVRVLLQCARDLLERHAYVMDRLISGALHLVSPSEEVEQTAGGSVDAEAASVDGGPKTGE